MEEGQGWKKKIERFTIVGGGGVACQRVFFQLFSFVKKRFESFDDCQSVFWPKFLLYIKYSYIKDSISQEKKG